MPLEYIYVLSNPSIPGLLKIGRTDRTPEQRIRELHSTGVPTPFVIEYSRITSDSALTESVIHRAFDAMGKRASAQREFFQVSVEDAIELVNRITGGSDTDSGLTREKWVALQQQQMMISVPGFKQQIDETRAMELELKMARLGEAGYADSFFLIAQMFSDNFIASAKSKTYWQRYLATKKQEIDAFCLPNGGRERVDYGNAIAHYIEEMKRQRILIDSDYQFVSALLVAGDRTIFEAYMGAVQHPAFPADLKLRASNI